MIKIKSKAKTRKKEDFLQKNRHDLYKSLSYVHRHLMASYTNHKFSKVNTQTELTE